MFIEDIKRITKENSNFRSVVHTGVYSQIVVMNIPIGGEIGEEIHKKIDQLLFIVKGRGMAFLEKEKKAVVEHDVVFVHAGTKHNLINIGEEDLKLFTVYSPPGHPKGTVHKTKEEAENEEAKYEL